MTSHSETQTHEVLLNFICVYICTVSSRLTGALEGGGGVKKGKGGVVKAEGKVKRGNGTRLKGTWLYKEKVGLKGKGGLELS